MKRLIPLVAACVLALSTPFFAHGASFQATNTVAPADAVDDDIYAVGETVSIRHGVGGDVFVAGERVETGTNNTVAGDVVAAGSRTTIQGIIEDDLFTAGSDVEVTATVAGDAFAAGANVVFSEESSVSGDAYLAGSNVVLRGTIEGTARIAGESITIESGATISGDLITFGANEPTIAEGATILGNRTHTQRTGQEHARSWRTMLLEWVRQVISTFVFALLVLFIGRGLHQAVLTRAQQHPGTSIGLGALVLLAFIPALVLLLVTIVAWPVALFVGLGLGTMLVLLSPLTALLIGQWVLHRLGRSSPQLTWQHALLGAVLLQTIWFVPIVGWLVGTVVSLLVLGALCWFAWTRV